MSEEKNGRLFPDARMVGEGTFQTGQGDQVQTIYVDLAGQVETAGLCLVKATEPQYELEKIGSIRLSRPPVFPG